MMGRHVSGWGDVGLKWTGSRGVREGGDKRWVVGEATVST